MVGFKRSRTWILCLAAPAAICFAGMVPVQAQMAFSPVPIEVAPYQNAPTQAGQFITVITSATATPNIALGIPFIDKGPNTEFGTPQNVGRIILVRGTDFEILGYLDDPEFEQPIVEAKFGGKLGPTAQVGDVTHDGIPEYFGGLPNRELENDDTGEEIDNAGQGFIFNGLSRQVLFTVDDPEPQELAEFAWDVAAVGDANNDFLGDVVTSAPFKDVAGEDDVGQVLLIGGADGTAFLIVENPEPEEGANFGYSLAATGDLDSDGVSDFVAGAPGQNAAYVISSATGALIFTLENPSASGDFGFKVAGGVDVSGDGIPDILVAAPLEEADGNLAQGRIYLFSGADGSPIRILDHPVPQGFARFGAGAALVADMNGDGKGEIIAGAPGQNLPGLVDAGEAYVLSSADGSNLATLHHPEPQAYAGFGTAVAGADFTGDGVIDPLVGAPGEDLNDPLDGDLHLDVGLVYMMQSANRAPVANAQLVSTNEDTAKAITLTGSDPDNDFLTFTIVGDPTNGVLTGTPPNLTYTPNLNVNGSDSFVFNVSDGKVTSPNATVDITITAVNDAPTANAGPNQTVDEGVTVFLDATASSDVEGDPITFVWKQTAGPVVRLRKKRTATPSFVAPAVTADTVLTFRVTVSDASASSTDTVDITVKNVSN